MMMIVIFTICIWAVSGRIIECTQSPRYK